jgi:hypothetical protein
MKVRIRIFGVALAFLGLLFFAGQGSMSQTARPVKPPLPTIMWEPDVSHWSPASRTQVMNIIAGLQQRIDAIPSKVPVTPAIVGQIAATYGANGNFTGADGWTYKGSEEIAAYLNKVLIPGHLADFRIEIKFVYAKEFTERLNKGKEAQDVVHSLYFVFSNAFMLNARIVDPPGSTNCPHIRICECDRSR